jgi:formate hydrogenlyase subunit 3/multisubunit Na+/H+ antiporter MnhD subunit
LASGAWVGLALLVVASVFTLASMLKIWSFAFQRTPGEAQDPPGSRSGAVALFAMIFLILGLGFATGPVQEYSRAAADALLDSSEYDAAVLSASGGSALQGVR